MITIAWSDGARRDLRAIFAYVAQDSRVYAKRLVDRIREKVQLLKNFPELGARVEDWETENIREIQEGNYRIIYRTKANSIQILTVIHAARQLPEFGKIPGKDE
jgi:plasmid stabilization system protein ParE